MNQFKIWVKKHFTNYNWKIKAKIITSVLIVFLIVFDQLIKLLAQNKLNGNEQLFLPGFINWHLIINQGSAFGLNQNKTGLLIAFAFIIAFLLLIWWVFSRTTSHMVAISFVFAGTIGNLIDRFIHNGGVVDFLKWDLFEPKTIFNLADVMVTIGICVIIISFIVSGIKSFLDHRQEEKQRLEQIQQKQALINKTKKTRSIDQTVKPITSEITNEESNKSV